MQFDQLKRREFITLRWQRAEKWPTSVTCPRCTVRRRRPSIAARFSVGFAARSSPRASRCYRQARSSSGHILAPAPIGTMRGVLSVVSVSATASASTAPDLGYVVGCTGREARSGGGLELEHGRTSTIFPSLVPHLQ